jgi:GNAT superfamily N-acetyltransferase
VKANRKEFKTVSMNFQSLLIFFIDGLSFIKLDPYWNYYILYKKTKVNNKLCYSVVGYATTYEFWRESDSFCKNRISQFLILPSYQSQGFGTQLLDVIHNSIQ